MNPYNRFVIFMVIALPLIWAGMIVGLCFLEAPLKFKAPGVSLEIGLGIGRLVFHTLNGIEWMLLTFWVMAYSVFEKRLFIEPFMMLIALLLALDTAWLLPALDKRVELLLSGNVLPANNLHFYYVLGEVLKLTTLLLAVYRIVSRFIIPFFKPLNTIL